MIYSPVVFFNKSLQAPIYHPYSATEKGVYGYEGRGPFGAFNFDANDATVGRFPENKFLGDSYKNGSFPFWNPYKGVGEPIVSMFDAGQFFPYQILEDISPVKSWDFFFLGRLIIAGFFSFLFLRSLKLSFLDSFLGGIIYMFSGGFVWFINTEAMVNAAMMIPILLLAIEMFLQNQSGLYIALSALSFGLILVA
ncbi:MAG: hypothetical protein Q8N69_03575, partial [bacterium]|nr:hypothetical protein [bacterium]